MIAPLHPQGRASPLQRRLVLRGLLPMTVLALALAVMLGVLHARGLGADAQAVARIQAIRIGGALIGIRGDDALRDALVRALSRSSPTRRAILHREGESDIVADSGPLRGRRGLHVRLSTASGELETVSDMSALFERRVAGTVMCLLLCAGVIAVFMSGRKVLEHDVVRPLERILARLDAFLQLRDARRTPGAHDGPAALETLLDELAEVRTRHDEAMAEALRQRLRDIARHARFIEQIGDHFRQPLQALALFVAGMQPGDDLRQRAVLGQMRTSLARLDEILDGALEMARFDAGAIEPHCTDLIAADLFVRVRTAVEDDVARLGVEVRWHGGRQSLHGDPVLLSDLLRRLVATAVLGTPHGRVLVAVRRRGTAIRLEVRDNGMGLEPAVQAKVFEDLVRLPGHPGYGLALAVARRITDTLGGSIGIRSRPGRGTLLWAEFADAAGSFAMHRHALAMHLPAF